jgi:WD40 repeat protein
MAARRRRGPGGLFPAPSAAGADGTVRLWNPATGRPAGPPHQTGAVYGVYGVAFSTDGKLLASAEADGTVRLWNPATGQPAGAPLLAGNVFNSVYGVAFSPNGKLLATGEGDATVRAWNPATATPSARSSRPAPALPTP